MRKNSRTKMTRRIVYFIAFGLSNVIMAAACSYASQRLGIQFFGCSLSLPSFLFYVCGNVPKTVIQMLLFLSTCIFMKGNFTRETAVADARQAPKKHQRAE